MLTYKATQEVQPYMLKVITVRQYTDNKFVVCSFHLEVPCLHSHISVGSMGVVVDDVLLCSKGVVTC